jgi:hypothetical protein
MLRITAAALLMAGLAAPAWSLSPEDVIRLKQAGVSDEVVQKMIEQENRPRDGSGVWETEDYIIYQAAPSRDGAGRSRRHEDWKERRSMSVADKLIIDGRSAEDPQIDRRRPLPSGR